ncbi:MAG: PQQ-binding-like beta-propeller repeat protein, partial [Desulfuromonadales bacterium]|nr:PQQ-binding-like beta-propeller repeat protein [Desulfuromonadales bacterium]NIS42402.1 PQQ-binding-like beta-propeller repeat protein [Desulfuromonadales bacterium]
AVTERHVVFGCDGSRVYALDAKSGEKFWEVATRGMVGSSPTIADGTVYFGSRDSHFY